MAQLGDEDVTAPVLLVGQTGQGVGLHSTRHMLDHEPEPTALNVVLGEIHGGLHLLAGQPEDRTLLVEREPAEGEDRVTHPVVGGVDDSDSVDADPPVLVDRHAGEGRRDLDAGLHGRADADVSLCCFGAVHLPAHHDRHWGSRSDEVPDGVGVGVVEVARDARSDGVEVEGVDHLPLSVGVPHVEVVRHHRVRDRHQAGGPDGLLVGVDGRLRVAGDQRPVDAASQRVVAGLEHLTGDHRAGDVVGMRDAEAEADLSHGDGVGQVLATLVVGRTTIWVALDDEPDLGGAYRVERPRLLAPVVLPEVLRVLVALVLAALGDDRGGDRVGDGQADRGEQRSGRRGLLSLGAPVVQRLPGSVVGVQVDHREVEGVPADLEEQGVDQTGAGHLDVQDLLDAGVDGASRGSPHPPDCAPGSGGLLVGDDGSGEPVDLHVGGHEVLPTDTMPSRTRRPERISCGDARASAAT